MRILVSSTQYPYYGGAATNAYMIIKALKSRGHSVCGLFFENSAANCDPDRVGGILKYRHKFDKVAARKSVEKVLGGPPEVILAKNYVAPSLCRRVFPSEKIIYLVSGSPLMVPLSKNGISAQKYLKMSDRNFKKAYGGKTISKSEIMAIKCSDAIIFNSDISLKVFLKTYKEYASGLMIFPPLNTSSIGTRHIRSDRKFSTRNIDVAFICSKFSRSVKNANLAKKIFISKDFSRRRKLVIGDGFRMFANVPFASARGATRHNVIMNYLSRTKLLICPSYFDASPNIVREAIDMGCNILVSKNCGWSELYGARSVCNDVYSVVEWSRKGSFLCNNKINYIKQPGNAVVSLENYILEVITK